MGFVAEHFVHSRSVPLTLEQILSRYWPAEHGLQSAVGDDDAGGDDGGPHLLSALRLLPRLWPAVANKERDESKRRAMIRRR